MVSDRPPVMWWGCSKISAMPPLLPPGIVTEKNILPYLGNLCCKKRVQEKIYSHLLSLEKGSKKTIFT
jgi:hypothetical protein